MARGTRCLKSNKTSARSGSPHSWARTVDDWLTGKAHIDGTDAVAIATEARWGAGRRLRLLVPAELRERFDKQRLSSTHAIWHGDLEGVKREASRMIAAWQALARAAWRPLDSLSCPPRSGRSPWRTAPWWPSYDLLQRLTPWSRTDGGSRSTPWPSSAILLENYREVTKTKITFPGAEVVSIRRDISDPLDGIRDGVSLEDTLSDEIPSFGQ